MLELIMNHELLHIQFNDAIFSKEQDIKIVFLFAISLGGFKIDSEFHLKEENKYLLLKDEQIHFEFKNVASIELGFDRSSQSWEMITKEYEKIRNYDLEEILSLPYDKPKKNQDIKGDKKNVDKNQNNKKKIDVLLKISSEDFGQEIEIVYDHHFQTVRDVWESLLSQTKTNKKKLENQYHIKVTSFAIMRVGLYNLYYRKFEPDN